MKMAKSYGPTVSKLLSRIGRAGFPAKFLRGVLPEWWTPQIERNPSAIDQLKIILASRLGLDLTALLERDSIEILVPLSVKYKGGNSLQEAGARGPFLAFCSAVARNIAAALQYPSRRPLADPDAERGESLSEPAVKWLSLNALLRRSWEDLNIAVVQIVNGPETPAGFDAASFYIAQRFIVVLAKSTPYPAWASFFVAHEMGHIASSHLQDSEVIVDEDLDANETSAASDHEEHIADRYALALLGDSGLMDVNVIGKPTPASITHAATMAGLEYRVDPGHLILRFAKKTGEWQLAQAALRRMHAAEMNVAESINLIAERFLQFDKLGGEAETSVRHALGLSDRN